MLNSRDQEAGVGLLEVLLTLVILSIGFLTAANMQIRSLKTNQDALLQSQATLLISDMMDRMRSNPEGVNLGAYNNKTTGSSVLPECSTKTCTALEIASLDLFEWSANFQNLRSESKFIPSLPTSDSGEPAVGSISAPVDGIYSVSLTWQEMVDGSEADRTVAVEFSP